MSKNGFYGILAILILGLASIISPIALSYLTTNITINTRGKILTIKTPITYESEIRGVFIHESIYGYSHDWTLIAQTLANYRINAVFVSDFGTFYRRPYSEIRAAIDAFHAYGIEYHSSMFVLGETKSSSSLGTEAIKYDGTVYSIYAHCPIKAHDYVLSAIQNYIGTFSDVDGIMLDYIRYADQAVVCYCPYCRATFEEWLGEGEITDWTPFYPSGARYNDFLEFRSIHLNYLVRDIHDTIKSINPNIVISEAAWPLFSDSAIYWRKWMGQDTAYWIKEGYIDFVAPMMYTKVVSGPGADTLESYINTALTYWMGGQPEGKIPLVAFLRVDWAEDLTPEQFAAQINYVRSRGLDGWIIWCYGGPGSSEPNPDIRNYLSVIDLPNTFSIRNIQVLVNNETSTTITWFTDLPATSKIEYSTNSLFNASWETQSGFHYWNITRIQSIIVENTSLVTEHPVTLAGLMPGTVYYFRVQSQRASDIATSKVMTFTTSG